MDELFCDENENNVNISELGSEADADQSSTTNRKLTTTIEKVLCPLSPIKSNANHSGIYDECFDETHNDSNLRINARMKYSFKKSSSRFSPIMRSTPNLKNKRRKRRSQHKNVWDKAIADNPELEKWIDSFNTDMKKVEETELSISEK